MGTVRVTAVGLGLEFALGAKLAFGSVLDVNPILIQEDYLGQVIFSASLITFIDRLNTTAVEVA